MCVFVYNFNDLFYDFMGVFVYNCNHFFYYFISYISDVLKYSSQLLSIEDQPSFDKTTRQLTHPFKQIPQKNQTPDNGK